MVSKGSRKKCSLRDTHHDLMLLVPSIACGVAGVPRLLTVGSANAAAHLSQLGLRPASHTRDGMWAPKELVAGMHLDPNWDLVVVSGREMDDTAIRLAHAAAASTATELVLASLGPDRKLWLDLARRGVGLLTLSEPELAVVEGGKSLRSPSST